MTTATNSVTKSSASNNVFVVDDDDAFRDSLTWLLDSPDYQIRSFSSGEQFLESYQGEPGCLLLDIRMPGINGLALQQELNKRRFRLPIIVITGHGDIPMAVTAIKNGAMDFVEKPFDDQVLLNQVSRALKLSEQWQNAAQQEIKVLGYYDTLSKREKQVMNLVVEGMANKVIAETLDISPKTVEVHRARVMSKMNAKSLPELVNQAQIIHNTDS
ncbi:response regulator transcription factor [Motiliproteus sp. MSK22-1]|uniref:response regulator transcription factor n=1 Tax=Motiliproteus sp. MSK22-1 TaxID=1897630 RepID=UPI0009777F64|nr:response regulator transcription factor [Motiliproteus sp. MSK22-1]OMH38002.1 DNA-binding response regulator [Motiliproteus sp. MSK22-1]